VLQEIFSTEEVQDPTGVGHKFIDGVDPLEGMHLYNCVYKNKMQLTLEVRSYACCTHAVLVLYSCCICAVLVLYSCCTHTVLVLYSCCTRAVLMLYSCCTLAVLVLYSRTVPNSLA
jgi:hypothetical protein